MKILHLADLHIGKNVNGFAMLEDQEWILGKIVGYVREARPQAVLIAGDVYDKAIPGADAVRLFDGFLTALAEEGAAVFAISGNHDSPERLGFASRLMRSSNVHIYGPYDGSPHKVTLEDEYGEINFFMLPYVRPLTVRLTHGLGSDARGVGDGERGAFGSDGAASGNGERGAFGSDGAASDDGGSDDGGLGELGSDGTASGDGGSGGGGLGELGSDGAASGDGERGEFGSDGAASGDGGSVGGELGELGSGSAGWRGNDGDNAGRGAGRGAGTPLGSGDSADTYEDAVRIALAANPPDARARNVLIAHQFMVSHGASPERSDSERISVGGTDSVDIRAVGAADAFDYIALGHLHGQQRVGAEHIRYAGSPLKYSFSECAHKKAALLVELREKGSLAITPLPLEPVRDMRKIRGPLAELLSEAVAKAANPEDYLHVTLTDEDEISDAIGKLRAVYPNVMALTFDNKRARAEPALGGASDLPGAQPLPLFEAFYLAQNGTEIKERQLAAVRRLLDARPAE